MYDFAINTPPKENEYFFKIKDQVPRCQSITPSPGQSTNIHLNNSMINLIQRKKIASECYQELDSYLQLSPSWDGYAGKVFDPKLIERAKKVVQKIESLFNKYDIIPNEITPGPASDGSVDVELSYNNNILIFTLYPDSEVIEIFLSKENSPTLELKENNEEDSVDEYLLGILY